MCGRYANSATPAALVKLFRTLNPTPNFGERYNIAPSEAAPVVRFNPETGERSMDLLRWGFVPSWTKDLKKGPHPINAKSETVAGSGMYARAFARRRCLVPATAFYEWTGPKNARVPYAIALRDREPMAFAGIWEGCKLPGTDEWLHTFATITSPPNELIGAFHDRQVVILPAEAWPAWLGEVSAEPAELQAMLKPLPADLMDAWRVSTAVNKAGDRDGPELLAPV